MVELTFLGSGGGRFITITQKRSTGGFILEDDVKIHIDPGPGALVKSWKYEKDPRQLDAIAVSHCHIDHSNDCGVLIEAMTNGVTKKKGALICSKSILDEKENDSKLLINHSERSLEIRKSLKAGESVKIRNIEIDATPSIHSDPTTIGFKFHTSTGQISYIADTQYFPDLVKWHSGARVLIMCVTRPLNARIPYHLNTNDAIKIAKEVAPELIVITHIGMKFHLQGVENERLLIEDKTKIKTIVAEEGKKVLMDRDSITTSL
ncbi:MAG: MBL fold metallo-hydrolase [Candidatus Methanofastidiosia archaeon]